MRKLVLVLAVLLVACQPQESNSAPSQEKEAVKPAAQPTEAPAQAKEAPAPQAAPVEKTAPVEEKDSTQNQTGDSLFGPGDPNKVLAKVNGVEITDAEVVEELEPNFANMRKKLEEDILKLKLSAIDNMIDRKLIEAAAKEAGKNPNQYLREEIEGKVADVGDEEAQAFYEKNKPRFQGRPYSQVAGDIKNQLKSNQVRIFQSNLMERLNENAEIEVYLEPERVQVSVDDDPSRGSKDAPVTIIEFTDYQCPYCAKVRPTLAQVRKEYGDKIHYVLRDFPLSFHKDAPKAAEAASCAGDQGKYWEYSELLWKNQKALQPNKLKEYAKQVGLDADKFGQCLDKNTYAGEVRKDMRDGSQAGVTGTPAFFINGLKLSGAQPLSSFKKVIDSELKKQARQDKPNS
ncbi:MAG: thioredoxin domain-containing protein [Deltaproteobacteria bacterium]|nr:thioredoxin domain-containing protein [Deltaproteobacteria bacterium]